MLFGTSILAFISAASAGSILHSPRITSAPSKHHRLAHRATSVSSSWSYVGCVGEPTDGRVLSTRISDDATTTPMSCTSACDAAGYSYAGMEYGEECWCGNALNQPQTLADSSCNVPCAGDSSQMCGAGWVLSLYSKSSSSGPDPITSWSEIGCAVDSDTRVLSGANKIDYSMTPEACQTFCTQGGFRYAGVESGKECYCGNSFDSSKLTDNSSCNSPCAGDSSKQCGGDWRVDVFQAAIPSNPSTTVTTPVPTTTHPTPSPSFFEIGCTTDYATRVLNGASKIDAAMTPLMCLSFCAGYKFAGLESGDECYCGNTFDTSKIDWVFTCYEPCAGDSTQHCGASWKLDVYSAAGSAPTTTASIASTTTSSIGSSPTQWTSQGCFEDQPNRTLNGKSKTDDAMTVEMCQSFCASDSFAYAGVENNKECYCGSQLTTYQPSPSGDCAAPCAGNSQETCGGNNWSISVWKAPSSDTSSPATWNDIGCYLDQADRTLGSAQLIDPSMTPAKCQDFCKSYRFAGLESGDECYCGDQWTSYHMLIPTVGSGTCLSSCTGDSSKKCGSGWALEIYTNPAKTSSSNAVYAGCYVDSSNRVLAVNPGEVVSDWGWSPSSCAARCTTMGYAYSGMEAGTECYCGQSLGSAQKVDDSQCQTPCASDPSKQTVCGGDWRLGVYQDFTL